MFLAFDDLTKADPAQEDNQDVLLSLLQSVKVQNINNKIKLLEKLHTYHQRLYLTSAHTGVY